MLQSPAWGGSSLSQQEPATNGPAAEASQFKGRSDHAAASVPVHERSVGHASAEPPVGSTASASTANDAVVHQLQDPRHTLTAVSNAVPQPQPKQWQKEEMQLIPGPLEDRLTPAAFPSMSHEISYQVESHPDLQHAVELSDLRPEELKHSGRGPETALAEHRQPAPLALTPEAKQPGVTAVQTPFWRPNSKSSSASLQHSPCHLQSPFQQVRLMNTRRTCWNGDKNTQFSAWHSRRNFAQSR